MHLVGGQPFVDFLNTAGNRSPAGSSMSNKLRDYLDLVAWGHHAGFLSAPGARELIEQGRRHPKQAASVVERAVELREALYSLCRTTALGGRYSAKSLSILNEELGRCPQQQQLIRRGDRFDLEHVTDPNALDQMLRPVTISAAQWFSQGDPSQLRICDGDECGWMFLDLSKNRSRRWCVMADCGNRAKVRRFREQLH